jgi:hypothetical protein
VKLLIDFIPDDIKFTQARKTATGTKIIDLQDVPLFQSPWTRVMHDIDNYICVDCKQFRTVLELIDGLVLDNAIKLFGIGDFGDNESETNYKSLVRGNYMYLPIPTNIIIFDQNKDYYYKSDLKKIKINSIIRFIFSIQKIYFKDYTISTIIKLVQIEIMDNDQLKTNE